AGGIARRRLTGLAAVDLRTVVANQRSRGLASTHAAARRRRDVVFVGLAAAVVVHAIARRIAGRRRAWRAAVVLRAAHAAGRAARRACAGAAGGGARGVLLIGGAVAVVIHVVAVGVIRGRRPGLARVGHGALAAAQRAGARAGTDAAAGRRDDEVL